MGLILVDSSVWIDFLRQTDTPQTAKLRILHSSGGRIAVGDLVLFEVLQGARDDQRFNAVRAFLDEFDGITICDDRVILAAARNYRLLRARGVTIRKTIDTLIATRCILDHIPLLYSDRDFDPFVAHLGLRSAMDLIPE